MPRKPNPYIAGPPVSGRNFYGREDIFRFVQDTFASPQQNVVVLWGQRRMGKTSVLHELSSHLFPEFHPIFFDLQDKAQQRLNEVLYDLAREIAGSLNLDSPPRDVFLRDDAYFHDRFLPQVYQNLGPKRLLLMFDEFDVLDMPREELARDAAVRAFFPYFRRALMDDRQLAFVFVVGRRLDELDELLQSTFKMAKTASISFLEKAEAIRLIVEPASDILEYDEKAVGQIISITACHPYLTQLVCSELFNYMEAAGRTRVTVNDVEAVIEGAIAAGSGGLTWLWGDLPMAERFVLSAVAHAAKEERAATQDEISRVLREYHVPFSGPELTRAPDTLIRWGFLRRTADGYEFVVELLRRWILREHSLEQAKRELELASPRAARLYDLASRAHQANELARAIRHYRDALAANPNHLQAQLGLAQALFEQGRIEEAITEYERAFSFDRARAWDGLIEARQAWAEALEKEGRVDEADQEYESILNIAPYDSRARGWLANRWTARGKKYLAEGRYKEAVAEHEKAAELIPGVQEGLIVTRRAWAEVLESEDRAGEADQQYGAILSVAPDDESVREWVANSLIERGDRYLEEGRYNEASQAYDQAESIQPEREQTLAQRRHQLALAPDYDKAMEAHKAGEWGKAWERWTELYRKAPDYRGRDGKGKRVADLLRGALNERDKVAERRRKLLPFLGGLAVILIVLAIGLWIGSWLVGPSETPTPTQTTPTPVESLALSPTVTVIPALTSSPVATATPTATPLPPPAPLEPRSILDVDINPNNSDIIYVIAKGKGIYNTTDGGYRWELIYALPNVESLALGRANPRTVFAMTDRVILRSTDGGANWQPPIEIEDQRTGQPLRGGVHVLAVVRDGDQIIYAGTDEGVYRSDDGGVTWELREGGMGGRPIYALVVAPGDGQLVYAAGRGGELWRTLDGGNSWFNLSCTEGVIYALAIPPNFDYETNPRLYIGTNKSTVAVSVDGGRNWQIGVLGNERESPLRYPLEVAALTMLDFRSSKDVLLAATGDRENYSRNGIYKSTDGGLSWWPKNNGLPTDSLGTYSVHSIAVDPQNNQIVYAGTFSGLYKSTNGGESWTRIP